MILNLVHFFIEVRNRTFLQVDFASGLLDFVLKSINHHVLSFTAVLSRIPRLHLFFLVTTVLKFELQQLVALLSVKLFTLPEMGDLN